MDDVNGRRDAQFIPPNEKPQRDTFSNSTRHRENYADVW